MPIQTHGTTHKLMPARKARASGGLLIELWQWVADWLTYWCCARWTHTWSKSSRGATMSSSSRRPWRSHNSSRTIRAIIKNGSNNADASGGLLIELWWWVANWFAILGCWVFSWWVWYQWWGFGLWSLCWHLGSEKEKEIERKRKRVKNNKEGIFNWSGNFSQKKKKIWSGKKISL